MLAHFLKQCRQHVTSRWSSATRGRPVHTQVWRCKYNQSLRGDDMPRAGGIATMLRLPFMNNQPQGLNACFVGIPFDSAASHRSGTRHGPRAIRHESSLIEPCNIKGAVPCEWLQVADIGDVPVNTFSIQKTANIITGYYRNILKADCVPLTMGGDHFITYPILMAVKERYGSVGLIHVDAHTDLGRTMFGETLAHGTPFYRAVEDGAVDPKYMFQIGIRASYLVEEFNDVFKWAKQKVGVAHLVHNPTVHGLVINTQGISIIRAEQCWYKSLVPLMEDIRNHMGRRPVYLSFDIDGLDPSFCPGTGRYVFTASIW